MLISLRRIVRFLRLADRDAEAATGLSAAQLFVLRALAEAPAASLVDLARQTLTDPSSVSTVVDRLVARRLVRRVRSKDDARRAELALTAAGVRTVDRAPRAPQVEIVARLKRLKPARLAMLSGSLDDLVGLIGAGDVAPRMLFEGERAVPGRQTGGR